MARILIVDDSPSQLMGIRRIVEKLGHEALTAEDGAAGVEAAKRELPDLILMDVVMPNLNGFQATRSITREATTKHIPIVLVTTKDQDTDRVWGMRQGAKAYITKPFSESELADMIQQMLGGEAPAAPRRRRVSVTRGASRRRTHRACVSYASRCASSCARGARISSSTIWSPGGLPGNPRPRRRSLRPDSESAGIFSSTAPPSVGTLTVAPSAASHGASGSM